MSESTNVLDYKGSGVKLHHEPPTLFESLGYPAHHFQDLGQQKEAATLGMWLFLGTEVLLFGGMFAGYFVYRNAYPLAWEEGSKLLNPVLGSINTAVLLASSFCVALAIHAAQSGHRKGIMLYLLLTMVLGMVFLGIKAREYTTDYYENIIPWMANFHPEHHGQPLPEAIVPQVRLFMLFYFIMTIIHATHMVAGISVMAVLTYLAHRKWFTANYYTPIEMAGLYWHFVDVVWVFLLPALYFARPL